MIENITEWTKSLNPVLQGVLGSAIFAVLVWLGRIVFNFLNDLNKHQRLVRQSREIVKIIIHKKFVNNNGMYYFTQGFLLVIFKSLKNLFMALLFLCIGKAMIIILNFPEIEFFVYYMVVQELLSGLSWLNPKWGDKDLSKYDVELVKEISEKLTSKDPLKGDQDN